MESQIDMTRRMTLSSLSPNSSGSQPEETEEDTLRKELNVYRSKSQSQLFELEILKTRNAELEKQHEIDTISMSKQWEDKDATLKKLHQLEQQKNLSQGRSSTKKDVNLFNLETENKQLKNQVTQIKDVNKQLLEDSLTFEATLKNRDGEIYQLKKQLSEAELQLLSHKRRMVPTVSSTTTATGALDCSEDFGKKSSKSKKSETWADIMESEDEAKKSAEEWAKKYRELQTSYFGVCMQLEKTKSESMSPEDEKKMYDLNQTIIKKDEEIRHLKQAENVNRIQMDYMQAELNKYQRSASPMSGDIPVGVIKQQKASYRLKGKNQHRKSTGSMVTKKVSQIISPSPSPLPRLRNVAKPATATPINTSSAAAVPNATTTATTTTATNTATTATTIAINADTTTPTVTNTATTVAAAENTSASTTTATIKSPTITAKSPTTATINNTTKTEPDYKAEDGFLTFTTEINGQLSRYSIKLPNGYKQPSKRSTLMREPMKKQNKLNPNAPTWKS